MHSGLGSIPFARRYLGYRVFFLFLRLLRCFSSAGLLRTAMYSPHGDAGFLHRVSPFGHLRIKGYMPLPEAFRSLLRPSSALIAKASALRPLCLTFRSHLSMIAFIYSVLFLTELINCSCLMSLTFAFTLGLFWNHLCIQFSGYVSVLLRQRFVTFDTAASKLSVYQPSKPASSLTQAFITDKLLSESSYFF